MKLDSAACRSTTRLPSSSAATRTRTQQGKVWNLATTLWSPHVSTIIGTPCPTGTSLHERATNQHPAQPSLALSTQGLLGLGQGGYISGGRGRGSERSERPSRGSERARSRSYDRRRRANLEAPAERGDRLRRSPRSTSFCVDRPESKTRATSCPTKQARNPPLAKGPWKGSFHRVWTPFRAFPAPKGGGKTPSAAKHLVETIKLHK